MKTLKNIPQKTTYSIFQFLTSKEFVNLKQTCKSIRNKVKLCQQQKLQDNNLQIESLQEQIKQLQQVVQQQKGSQQQVQFGPEEQNKIQEAIQEGNNAIKEITKKALTELKSINNPNETIKMVIEALTILFKIKPEESKDKKRQKVLDY